METAIVMTRERASQLTEQIRSAGDALVNLLVEAYQGQAWQALGHKSWAAYCREEFGMTTSQAENRQRQVRVIDALASAIDDITDDDTPVPVLDIPQKSSSYIAPHLPAAVSEVREAVAAGTEPKAAIAEIVQKYGRPFPTSDAKALAVETGEYVPAEDGRMYDGRPLEIAERESELINHVSILMRAIEHLANETEDPVAEAAQIPSYFHARIDVAARPALEWLSSFVEAWE